MYVLNKTRDSMQFTIDFRCEDKISWRKALVYRYYDDLLSIAEGDPKAENKRVFSEFLVWASDGGLLSQRQAREYYNRYFNVKFVSLQSDYNNCTHTCPRRDRVMLNMERELTDKERGLLKVSLDNAGYYRADELYQEVELVLEATCTACAAGQ